MRQVSLKRAIQLKEYRLKVRPKYLKENPICHCCKKYDSREIHHKRGRFGKRLLDENYFMAVCFGCHRKIENERAWAYELGYLLRR